MSVVILLATVGITQILNVQSGNLTADTSEDWISYDPISDTNLNSSYYEMLTDSANNVHIFWCASNREENYSLLIHETIFNNGSKKTSIILEVTGQSAYTDFKVDIDTTDRIHLIQLNYTGFFTYYIGYNDNWEIKNEFQVDVVHYSLVTDGSGNAHFIYSVSKGNLFDRVLFDSEWHEKQITFYELESVWEYFLIFSIKTAKSKQGKIALFYSYRIYNEIPGAIESFQLHCLVYNGYWSAPKVMATSSPVEHNLAFDDTERLHLIWPSIANVNEINYQTLNGQKWSKVEQKRLFEKTATMEGYYSFHSLDLETQGRTILIAFAVGELMPTYFDYDHFVAYSNDGETFTSVPVYRSDTTSTAHPQIESTTEGNVYVIAFETPFEGEYNRTIYLGVYEGLFTYQTTAISNEYLVPIFATAVIALAFRKKARRKTV